MEHISGSRGVVVLVETTPPPAAALKWAAREASLRHVPLTLVAVDGRGQAAGTVASAVLAASDLMASRDTVQVRVEVRHDDAGSLIEMSGDAELVVVGAGPMEQPVHVLRRSVPARLVEHASCPVTVVHDVQLPDRTAPVLVGVDASVSSDRAVELAFDEASRRGVGLVAVHAWSDPSVLGLPTINWSPIEWADMEIREHRLLAERLAGHCERYPEVGVERLVICGRTAHELQKHSTSVQLVVIGGQVAHGHAGLRLGSLTRYLLEHVLAPVMVTRQVAVSNEAVAQSD